MGMTTSRVPRQTESLASIHASLDADIDLLDTGDSYGTGDNELLARGPPGAARRRAIGVEFGALRAPTGAFTGIDAGDPRESTPRLHLRRLGTDYVDEYRPAPRRKTGRAHRGDGRRHQAT